MAFMELHFFSRALNVAVSVNVILPEAAQGIGVAAEAEAAPPKVLYLLHGYSDDHSIWMRRTSVERYAATKNLAVIMPAVNHSFYINEHQGERYWDFVATELPEAMQRFFRLSDRPEDTFVAGLSMGGYGAMRLALTYPGRYAAAAAFSGALDIVRRIMDTERQGAGGIRRIFEDPDSVQGSELDLFYLMKKNAKAPSKPKILVACGTADFIYQDSKKFFPALRKAGWDAEWSEKPDTGHVWSYWDEMIEIFIDRYC